jgi:dienelactone hydrolase/pimeloyl-ACP methyl ester carboxylesterase
MPDHVLSSPQPGAFDESMRAQARALRENDRTPQTRAAWIERRRALREAMLQAMGPMPAVPCALNPRILGAIRRAGYRIEKLLFESRPDVWVTANLYLPEPVRGRRPAVLCVHGHWPGARRDPVVQARCLGLVKLGFVVLAVDAFGAGERYTTPAPGTYHGALYGSTLWPTGHTLLGMQVYDNRRAVDYLLTRPEVDGQRLGITGASGGGNQTMYAVALDERLAAAVPVCSVGTYQAYLHAACCVCEVLPGALRFAEEGDVLGLVAPRALLVINATRDALQFSVAQARQSIERARAVYQLYHASEKLQHATFESPHDYNKAMRETMYGWMTRWLKNEGDGRPIPEPGFQVERAEDLSCLAVEARPPGCLLPPTFAAREARRLLARADALPDHVESWESTAVAWRSRLLRDVLGGFPASPRAQASLRPATTHAGTRSTPLVIQPEPNLPVPALLLTRGPERGPRPVCILLHMDGKNAALDHRLAGTLLQHNWAVVAPDLRATGETRPEHDAIAGAPDHNSAEHALWLGRPLLGQWVFDVKCLLDWLALQPGLDRRRFAVAGLGQAGIVALCAGALLDEQVASVLALGAPASFVTGTPYPQGTRMGLLAPGILRVGDLCHLAALCSPRRLAISQSLDAAARALAEKPLQDAYRFTKQIYRLYRADNKLKLTARDNVEELVTWLNG